MSLSDYLILGVICAMFATFTFIFAIGGVSLYERISAFREDKGSAAPKLHPLATRKIAKGAQVAVHG
jgi:hypothetical protein